MRQIKCPDCNEKCIKHGVLKSGSQRWFCKQCKVAFTVKINNLSNKDEKITYDSVIGNFTVNPITNTQIIEVKYKSLNPQQSYDLLYSTTENLIAYSKELYPTVNIKVVEQVHVDYSDLISKKNMIVGASLILGLLTGIGIVIAAMYFDNTFKNKGVLEEEIGIPVIGVIPDFQG